MTTIEPTEAESASSDHYEAGQILGGKYQLLGKAGEGATGTVWIALNTALESRVAIKLVRPEMRLPVIVERVMREARAAARLTHSAIVRVFDLGETESGDPYIVMELLEGESLRSMLDREVRLTPERALAVLLPIASAMHLAHQQGIIHRDIKPDNIMLARVDGGRIQPKLVDFGIAKLSFGDPGGVTTGALVIGTPGYMSPEQAGGGEIVDNRTDIWSLCALLYEMVSGDTPFPSVNTLEALCSVIRDPLPSLLGDRIKDEALWSILERGLRKDAKERWPSMRALGEALSNWLTERGVEEDISGVPLRALWLDAPPVNATGRTGRPLAGEGVIRRSIPMRALSEAPVVSNAVLFSEIGGGASPAGSRSRYFVMAGLAMLTAALSWKIAFSPVTAQAGAGDSSPPAALVTARGVPLPPPMPTVAPTPQVAVSAAKPTPSAAAPAAPKPTVDKYGRPPVRTPLPPTSATPSPYATPTPAPAPTPTALLNEPKHTGSSPAGAASPPPTPVSTLGTPGTSVHEGVDGR